jgi:eukaryotic-like serine/threonine-protein kinase
MLVTDVADARVGGRYRLRRKLASGGMGTVWEGWDERLRRPVAVKQLHVQPWLPPGERAVAAQRMMREARIAARLRHPNAVQVFDVVEEDDGPCLIMEYVPSRSLQQIAREDGPLTPVEVARLGTQVAAALAAAHRAGIVHRDVKPGNVLVTDEGTAKITDFGISRAYGDHTLTATGMVTGTPAYLAPEVARGAASDFASDVYALGATLYMAVEGQPPFGTDDNPMAVLHRVASGKWEPPSSGGPLTPVLATMMSADAAARPSMVDVANTLPALHPLTLEPAEPSAAAQPQPGTADAPTSALAQPAAGDTRVIPVPPPVPPVRPPVGQPAAPGPVRRQSRSWLPIVAVLAVIALGLTLAAVLLLNKSGDGNTASNVPATGRSHVASPSHRAGRSSAPARSSAAKPPAKHAGPPAKHGGQPTAQELAQAVVHYFTVVPGDLDTGWSLLTRHFQQTKAQDRETYDEFWNSVDRVEVRYAAGYPPHDAAATLVYHYKDGRVVTQQTQFRFVRQGGVLKIDQEF